MSNMTREKAITRTSIIGIIANVFLAGFKAVAGLLAGSIAIVLDAVNNVSDALSSIITIVGIKLAKKKPNEKHPFGYGRVEYFSTIILSLIILSAGVSSVVEAVQHIINPDTPEYSLVTIVIVSASVVVKIFLGLYVKKQGEKYNSDGLVASGTEATFDAIISASTLLGAVVMYFFHFSIDAIIATIISVLIVKAGLEMLLETVSHVVGNRADSEITKEIKMTVASLPEVQGAYDLILHNYGPDSAMGSIHVEVPAELPAKEIHKLTKVIQQTVWDKFQIFVTVGIYAVETKDEEILAMRQRINEICTAHEGVINSHGIYINQEEKEMSFDVTIDFTVRDYVELQNEIVQEIQNQYGEYQININFDANYSD